MPIKKLTRTKFSKKPTFKKSICAECAAKKVDAMPTDQIVSVSFRKNIENENMTLFCAELQDHVETALGDLLEPDEVKACAVEFRKTIDGSNHWQINTKVQLLLLHPERLADIFSVIQETVQLHAETFPIGTKTGSY